MKILVLGSGGQLGRCLQQSFKGGVHEVVFCSRSEVDIIDYQIVRKKIDALQPKTIINASAYTDVDKAEEEFNLTETVNHEAVVNLALCCMDYDCLLIHISTDYVFDGKNKHPYTKNLPTNPQSVYGKSKRRGEIEIINSGCRYFIFRTSSLFCELGKNFVRTMLTLGKSRKEIRVVCDEIGCPTYGLDLATGLLNVVNHTEIETVCSGIFHYSGGPSCSWFNFSKEIFVEAERCGLKVPDRLIPVPSRDYLTLASRPEFSVLSTKKFEETFKLEVPDWIGGVRRVVELYSLKKN